MTRAEKPYYSAWLDNLADDVTLEGAVLEGTVYGADDVRAMLILARQQYDYQDFRYTGPCGDRGFLEDYSASVGGVPTSVVVLVNFNVAGQTERIIVNHRPTSAALNFSQVMYQKSAGTPRARYFRSA
jgi:hypothetical protein